MRNFNQPYFSRDIAEFWRRWHISLTTWFRDYLYIPLGGSRCGTWKKVRNTFVVFTVSGLWHGANWTFVVWGAFHAICFLPLLLTGHNRKHVSDTVAEGRRFPTFGEFWRMGLTLFVVVIGWTFFRAPDIGTAFVWQSEMLVPTDLRVGGVNLSRLLPGLPLASLLVVIEWLNRGCTTPRLPRNPCLRWILYYVILFAIGRWFAAAQTFIYFQF